MPSHTKQILSKNNKNEILKNGSLRTIPLVHHICDLSGSLLLLLFITISSSTNYLANFYLQTLKDRASEGFQVLSSIKVPIQVSNFLTISTCGCSKYTHSKFGQFTYADSLSMWITWDTLIAAATIKLSLKACEARWTLEIHLRTISMPAQICFDLTAPRRFAHTPNQTIPAYHQYLCAQGSTLAHAWYDNSLAPIFSCTG